MFVRPVSARAGLLAAVAALALTVSTAATSAPASASLLPSLGVACPDPTTRPFLPWNDLAFYAYVPNGGFESGATGWALSGGAKVVAGNETFFVRGPGSNSLAIPAGSSVTSPKMCVGLLSSKMRFFVKNAGSQTSRLKMQVIYGGGTGGLLGGVGSILGISDVASISSGKAWQPSAEVPMLGGTLPLLTQWVQFRFKPADSSGGWRIDDVYLDPLMHR
ncbi:MAG: hypothetical protein QOF68_281 [Gaiellales bacterium]|nr:hypothetical protein [Gaiellales bacterium]